jgi:hypothetical protein
VPWSCIFQSVNSGEGAECTTDLLTHLILVDGTFPVGKVEGFNFCFQFVVRSETSRALLSCHLSIVFRLT